MQTHPESSIPQSFAEFADIPAFNAWMNSLENVQFACLRTTVQDRSQTGYKTYVCRRSCETATQPLKTYILGDPANAKSRPSRSKSSCKLDEACSARIFAKFSPDGRVSVRYVLLHIGHDPLDLGDM